MSRIVEQEQRASELWDRMKLDRFIPVGLENDAESLRKARLLIVCSFSGFLLGLVLAPLRFYVSDTMRSGFALLAASLVSASAPFLMRLAGSVRPAAGVLCGVIFCIVVEVTLARGGYPIAALIWACLIPLLALLTLGRRAAVVWALIVATLFIGLGAFALIGPGFAVRMTQTQVLMVDIEGLVAFLILAVSLMWLYERERRRTVAALEAANHSKEEFLARMSHQVRTPMFGVLGTIDLLMPTALTGDQRNYMGMIRTSAHELLVIVDDILDFARAEKGAIRLETRPFDPEKEIDGVVRLFESKAKEKGLALSFQMDGLAPGVLLGDVRRLNQVLVNLVSNAVKFTQRGEVEVKASIRVSSDDRVHLEVSVQDTGIGIAAADVAKIFTPFGQVDESMSSEVTGRGLGLSVSRELVEQLGGLLSVESEPGRGSTFSFSVPFGAPEQVVWDTSTAPVQPIAGIAADENKTLDRGLQVLLAEDNAINAQVTLAMLRGLGCHADIARNGIEAVDLAQRSRYDLILMDCQMPKMDGYEAAEKIRAIPEAGETPIVALTAHALTSDRERCLAAGMNDYLPKPIGRAVLEVVLARWAR